MAENKVKACVDLVAAFRTIDDEARSSQQQCVLRHLLLLGKSLELGIEIFRNTHGDGHVPNDTTLVSRPRESAN